MSDDTVGRSPPEKGRFRKGVSGNPKGRPKRSKRVPSAFDIVLDKSLSVTIGGRRRELTVEEGLQQKTYQAALAGKRMAVREVLKMINKREGAQVKRRNKHISIDVETEALDPTNADEALVLLGIATREITDKPLHSVPHDRILLEPWAVKAALARRRGPRLDAAAIAEIRRSTWEGLDLKLPEPKK